MSASNRLRLIQSSLWIIDVLCKLLDEERDQNSSRGTAVLVGKLWLLFAIRHLLVYSLPVYCDAILDRNRQHRSRPDQTLKDRQHCSIRQGSNIARLFRRNRTPKRHQLNENQQRLRQRTTWSYSDGQSYSDNWKSSMSSGEVMSPLSSASLSSEVN